MTRAKADPNGKKPTAAQAKAVWDAEIEPTLDKVFVKLHAAGFTGMAFSTLQRWKAKGWRERKIATSEQAAAAKRVVAEVVDNAQPDGSPKPDDALEAEIKQFADITAADLAVQDTRESLIARILISKRIQRRATELVQFAPKETAALIEALKGPTSNVTVVIPEKPAAQPQPQPVSGRLIEHDANERPMTPLQASIREFKAQQGMKVVK